MYLIILFCFIALCLSIWLLVLKYNLSKIIDHEKDLEFCEGRFKTLFDIAPIFINSFDERRLCTYWNKECHKIFGYTIDEINLHGNILALLYPDPNIQKKVIDSFTNSDKSTFRQLNPLTKNGNTITTICSNINLPNGEMINIGMDITSDKEAEKKLSNILNELKEVNTSLQNRIEINTQEIHKKEQLLLQHSRLAQMGEMISMIAHQWRQPLSVIDMTAFDISNKIALNKYDLNDVKSQKDFLKFLQIGLNDIDKYTQYLTGTIEDFKNFFKPNKEKSLVTLNVPIEKALSILKPVIQQESIEISIDTQTNTQVNIYIYEVMQVIVNIIKNSIDNFIEKDINHRKISLKVTHTKDNVSITICDNGKGIKTSYIDKIFDPYFSTKDNRNGTGLGLYISKVIIENHAQGKLNVANVEDGVCFEIILSGGI